jgi:hypothetical protein
MKQLEMEHNTSSIAFEILGPPRLSKLLHEANLLKIGFSGVKSVLQADARNISAKLSEIVQKNSDLRAQIISIGIPILMPDGKTLLRGNDIKVPTREHQDENELKITSAAIDTWAHDGWVDLRPENMNIWKKRLSAIVNEVSSLAETDTSSRFMRTPEYWDRFQSIDPGKIVGWIFTEEEKGLRMKA